jgi:hypothetical protein
MQAQGSVSQAYQRNGLLRSYRRRIGAVLIVEFGLQPSYQIEFEFEFEFTVVRVQVRVRVISMVMRSERNVRGQGASRQLQRK